MPRYRKHLGHREITMAGRSGLPDTASITRGAVTVFTRVSGNSAIWPLSVSFGCPRPVNLVSLASLVMSGWSGMSGMASLVMSVKLSIMAKTCQILPVIDHFCTILTPVIDHF